MNSLRAAWLSLGSNLGDREKNLREAVARLTKTEGVSVTAVSSIYETEPWGKRDQPGFLNIAAAIETALSPEALLAETQAVEQAMGRVRHEHWGPRVIDLDILAMEGVLRQTPELIIPHPYMTQRAFVLTPLAEIAPALTVAGKTAEEWSREMGNQGVHFLKRWK